MLHDLMLSGWVLAIFGISIAILLFGLGLLLGYVWGANAYKKANARVLPLRPPEPLVPRWDS